jgi:hypothetical protein
VFNNTFQFTVLLQPDGTVVEVNDTALQFSDNDRADVIGRPSGICHHWMSPRKRKTERKTPPNGRRTASSSGSRWRSAVATKR